MVIHLAAGVWALIAFSGARITGLTPALLVGVVLHFLYGSEEGNKTFAAQAHGIPDVGWVNDWGRRPYTRYTHDRRDSTRDSGGTGA